MNKIETIYHLNTGASVSSYTNNSGEDLSIFESKEENIEIHIKTIQNASNTLLEKVIALNQGRLILPGKHSTLLLEKLAFNQAQISYGGYKYKFYKDAKHKFAAIRLADGLEGEFKVGIQKDAFFIPLNIKIAVPVEINILTRYYNLSEDLAKAEYRTLQEQNYIITHHFNYVSNKDFKNTLTGERCETKYLEKHAKLSGINSKTEDIPLYIARLKLIKELYKNGKTFSRPVLERKRHFTDAEKSFVNRAIKENFVGDENFKMATLGKYDFDDYLREGANYLHSSTAISKVKITEIVRGIVDIISNNDAETNVKLLKIGLYPSTIGEALAKELTHLFEHLPIKINVVHVEKLALNDTYKLDEEYFPNSPLNELKSRLVHENISKTWIKIKVAQESAFQILKAKNSRLVCEVSNSEFPQIEKNYQAALIANRMAFWDCEDLYNAYRRGLY